MNSIKNILFLSCLLSVAFHAYGTKKGTPKKPAISGLIAVDPKLEQLPVNDSDDLSKITSLLNDVRIGKSSLLKEDQARIIGYWEKRKAEDPKAPTVDILVDGQTLLERALLTDAKDKEACRTSSRLIAWLLIHQASPVAKNSTGKDFFDVLQAAQAGCKDDDLSEYFKKISLCIGTKAIYEGKMTPQVKGLLLMRRMQLFSKTGNALVSTYKVG